MIIQKKAVLFQRALYVIFGLIGLFAIVKAYVDKAWVLYVFLGVAILYGVINFVIYKKRSEEEVLPITNKALSINKYTLYAFMGTYVIYVLSDMIESLAEMTKAWIFGPILILIAIFGVVLQQLTLSQNKS